MAAGALDDGTGLTIVTEQLAALGGAARILEALRERFPRALLMGTRFDRPPGSLPTAWDEPVRLVGSGGRKTHFLAPLHSRRMGRERLDGLVLSIGSNSWAHAIGLAPGARHIAMAHGPPRPLYGESDRYLSGEPPVLRPALRAAQPLLRREYRRRLASPHRRISVSRWSAAALERIHGVPWDVVHPPVRTGYFTPAPRGRNPAGPLVIASRLVPHKRVDQVIEAVRGLDAELVVVGGGPARAELEAAAPANVRFAGSVADSELREHYRSASLFVSANREEFGIALAEAQATGIPVVAPGAAEVVAPGTGLLVADGSAKSLRRAILEARARNWNAAACRANALRFAPERFTAAIEQRLSEEAANLPRRPRAALAPPARAAAA
jgi:glycosyltransferase involved in cell wall biosynthesis